MRPYLGVSCFVFSARNSAYVAAQAASTCSQIADGCCVTVLVTAYTAKTWPHLATAVDLRTRNPNQP